MPTNAELAKQVATMEANLAAILAAVSGNATAPTADVATPQPEAKAAKSTATRKIVVPTERIEHEDGTAIDFAQVYATEASGDRKAVAFKTHGGFRVRMTTRKADGAQDGRYVNMTAAQMLAIRNMDDDAFTALVSDARVA